MLTDNQISQIKQVLKLEKLTVVQKMDLFVVPTVMDEDFHINLNEVRRKLKLISKNIELKIVDDAVIYTTPLLQAPETIEKENT